MIAHIKGTIAEKFENSVIVDVNGVGYELTISAPHSQNNHKSELLDYSAHSGQSFNG